MAKGFKKVAFRRAEGGSLQGRINTTYARLVKVFGQPNSKGDGYKVDVQWILQAGPGVIVTIYNWKDGKNYLGKEGLAVSRIRDWHIGGETKGVVNLIRAALG
ncbi:hypothetical protein LCGC14_0510390 [marine sediment metagenome]|uniref:Uncharacterized protein n=1 Tax=marine sediment metagenome TaxID=412755 RepID=A0A0F9V9V2_9ZZZZ